MIPTASNRNKEEKKWKTAVFLSLFKKGFRPTKSPLGTRTEKEGREGKMGSKQVRRYTCLSEDWTNFSGYLPVNSHDDENRWKKGREKREMQQFWATNEQPIQVYCSCYYCIDWG